MKYSEDSTDFKTKSFIKQVINQIV